MGRGPVGGGKEALPISSACGHVKELPYHSYVKAVQLAILKKQREHPPALLSCEGLHRQREPASLGSSSHLLQRRSQNLNSGTGGPVLLIQRPQRPVGANLIEKSEAVIPVFASTLAKSLGWQIKQLFGAQQATATRLLKSNTSKEGSKSDSLPGNELILSS